jgi:hypothetical protein
VEFEDKVRKYTRKIRRAQTHVRFIFCEGMKAKKKCQEGKKKPSLARHLESNLSPAKQILFHSIALQS